MFTGHYLFKSDGKVISEVKGCTASEALRQFFEIDFPSFLKGIKNKEGRIDVVDKLSSTRGEFIKNKEKYDDYIKASKDEKSVVRYKKIEGNDWLYYYSVDRNYHNIQDTMKKIADTINTKCGTSFSISYIG